MTATDFFISTAIIGGLLLSIISKMTGQTIGELISGIRDAFSDRGEEAAEYSSDALSYYG